MWVPRGCRCLSAATTGPTDEVPGYRARPYWSLEASGFIRGTGRHRPVTWTHVASRFRDPPAILAPEGAGLPACSWCPGYYGGSGSNAGISSRDRRRWQGGWQRASWSPRGALSGADRCALFRTCDCSGLCAGWGAWETDGHAGRGQKVPGCLLSVLQTTQTCHNTNLMSCYTQT